MARYIFRKEEDPENDFDNTVVEVIVDTVNLADLQEAFPNFLRAAGFIVPYESEEEEGS